MPAAVANLVHETSTTTGTGNLTLSNISGKQSFNTAFGNGATTDVFNYYISNRDAAEYERGTGHMSAASTLVRDTVKESSNSGSAVNFSAGTKDVTCDWPAQAQGAIDGFLYGMTLSNNGTDATNDIDFAAGVCADSAGEAFLRTTAAITKRLDAAWAVGSGNGGLDTGSIANGTYHCFAIRRPDTGVVDFLFSTSASAPTMPTSYTQKRRIGSILRESAAIVAFTQRGDVFRRTTGILDVNVTSAGTAAVTRTLSVPTGIVVQPIIECGAEIDTAGAIEYVLLSSLTETDTVPNDSNNFAQSVGLYGAGLTDGIFAASPPPVFTNTSAQIRSRQVSGTASSRLTIRTLGWVDTRGRLAA